MFGAVFGSAFGVGLRPRFRTAPQVAGVMDRITAEAAIGARPGDDLRIDIVAEEGALVPEGAPVARLRDHPGIALVAPMAARVARIALLPGRRLSEIVLFHEAGGDRQAHVVRGAEAPAALRALMQAAGFWPRLRRRPFGGMPAPGETPAALVVMAADTRPLAPDPRAALDGREDDLERGLAALTTLTEGPVVLCEGAEAPAPGRSPGVRRIAVGRLHPHGLPGHAIHRHAPAGHDRPVWDLLAEDVADLGALLRSGHLPQTRLVRVAGPALSETRTLRCQAGADLRALSYGAVLPGPHVILSGSPLDGHPARWLSGRDRQVTVVPHPPARPQAHWFRSALTRWSLPRPVIPSAALMQSAGAAFPVMAMVRALAVGDDETAMRLGALSLLEEDLALMDYVTGGDPGLAGLLRAMLDRTAREMAA